MKNKQILDNLTEIESLAQNSPRREKISRVISKARHLLKELDRATETTD